MIKSSSLLVAGLAVLLLGAAPSAPRDGAHDFDFSFGKWKTHISRLVHPLTGSTEWTEYDGTHIIRQLWNGRASYGELEADGPSGHVEAVSPRLYDPQSHQWSVRYGSSRGGALGEPVYGTFNADGSGEFYGQDTLNGRVILVRNLYIPLSARSRRLEIAYSADGGKSWETNWIMVDTKVDESAG